MAIIPLKIISLNENGWRNRAFSRSYSELSFCAVGFLFLVYVGYRAANIAITYDEAFSYFIHSSLSLKEILLNTGLGPANNHIFNTLFLKYISTGFNNHEFTLRILSVTSYFFYIISSYKILNSIISKPIKLMGFCLLNLNVFLLDFFSLARGYSLSLGLMMLSLYGLKEYIDRTSTSHQLASLGFGALAVISNNVFLNYYLGLVGILSVLAIYDVVTSDNRLNQQTRPFVHILIISILLGASIYHNVTVLINAQALYYGGVNGFWKDTIGTLINVSFPNFSNITIIYISIFVGILITSWGFSILYIAKTKTTGYKYFLSISFILLIACLSTIIQNIVFDNKFLIERTALLFIPLFIIVVIYMSNLYIQSNTKVMRYIGFGLLSALSILMLFNFIYNFNLTYTITWKNDSDSKSVIQYLASIQEQDNSYVILSTDKERIPSLVFYRYKYKLDWLNIEPTGLQNNLEYRADVDYYYFFHPDIIDISVSGVSNTDLLYYPLTGYRLRTRLN